MMDYLLTDKTLYVFVVEPQGLRLLDRNIDYKDLQKNVVLFKKNILNTINSLNNYNKNKIEEHYWTSCRLGFILYEEIIGSFELDKLISEFQYFMCKTILVLT